MYIISVMPIQRAGKETLSYFSLNPHEPGAIIKITLRSKTMPAVVTMVKSATAIKQELKTLNYRLKKIEGEKPCSFINPVVLDSARRLSDFFAVNTGAVLCAMLPGVILKNNLKPNTAYEYRQNGASKNNLQMILQGAKQRLGYYRIFVRENFARGKSVICIAPTTVEAEKIADEVCKGIDSFTYVLHHSMPGKTFMVRWNEATLKKHPVFIVGTYHALTLPRNDLGAIIVDHESSRHYKLPHRPFLDLKIAAEIIANAAGADLLLGGDIVQAETFWRYKNGEIEARIKPKTQISEKQIVIIDMRVYKKQTGKGLKIFAPEVETLLKETASTKKTLIFTARRGLAPVTVCGDCDTALACSDCVKPLVLRTKENKKEFVCRACGFTITADTTCLNCGSWKLNPIGIGSELVEDYCKTILSGQDTTIIRIDSDSAPTKKASRLLINKFNSAKAGILIGTELALNALSGVSHVVVASIDSLLSLPGFRMNERILDLALQLRALASKKMYLQTRLPGSKILQVVKNGDLAKFYEEELRDRKKFLYPPFVRLIKITAVGEKTQTENEILRLKNLLGSYGTSVYPSFEASAGRFSLNMLLRLPRDSWPDEKLLGILRSLPPKFKLEIEPESVL